MSNLLARARKAFPSTDLSDKEVISLYQKYIRSKVSSESCKRNGKLGYAATVAAGKSDIAGKKAADWRFDNPSDLEQIIMTVLQKLELPVDRSYREVSVGKYYADFKYGNIIIEVNDDTWHTNAASFKSNVDVESHDAKKYAYLRSEGYTIITLAEKDVRSGVASQILIEIQDTLKEQVF